MRTPPKLKTHGRSSRLVTKGVVTKRTGAPLYCIFHFVLFNICIPVCMNFFVFVFLYFLAGGRLWQRDHFYGHTKAVPDAASTTPIHARAT